MSSQRTDRDKSPAAALRKAAGGLISATTSSHSRSTTERFWPLPLYDHFLLTVKGEIADLRSSTGRQAGSLIAVAFF